MKLKYVYWCIFLSPQLAMLIGNCWHLNSVAIMLPLLVVCIIDFSFGHCTNMLIQDKVIIKGNGKVKDCLLYNVMSDFYSRLSGATNKNTLQVFTVDMSDFDRFMFKLLFKRVICDWCKKQFGNRLKITFVDLNHQICYKLEKFEIGVSCLDEI